MTDQHDTTTDPVRPGDDVIERAARTIYEGFFTTQPLRYVPWDQAEESIKDNNRLRACALADAGLLDGFAVAREARKDAEIARLRNLWPLNGFGEDTNVRQLIANHRAWSKRAHAELADLRAKTVVLPDDWREQAQELYSDDGRDGVMMIEAWQRDAHPAATEGTKTRAIEDPWTTEAGLAATRDDYPDLPTAGLLAARPAASERECTDVRCSRINGRCVGYHCSSCGEPSSMLGHPKCQAVARPAATEEADVVLCTCGNPDKPGHCERCDHNPAHGAASEGTEGVPIECTCPECGCAPQDIGIGCGCGPDQSERGEES